MKYSVAIGTNEDKLSIFYSVYLNTLNCIQSHLCVCVCV